ncbi:MAG: UDP-N-acetylmuramate dehydrogenase [Treponema sp.]|nr:UDP-N-acetylmuramate dehydrogenase [Treponema sp.]
MINDFLLHSFDIAKIAYKKDFPLAPKSTFKVGSTADLFIAPETQDQFMSVVSAALAAEEKFFILGGGSNIVFPDQAYHGIIISTENLNNILMTDDEKPEDLSQDQVLVSCEAGTPMANLVSFCTKHNLSGMEEFAGLPGSVGGALYMNARCFEKSISQLVYNTSSFIAKAKTRPVITSQAFKASEWDYKKSPFQINNDEDKRIICAASFVLTQKSEKEHSLIEAQCKKYINERIDKGHFKYPSAGSVFKNNRAFGKPSGALIDQAGLKGTQIGGAQIAPFHGNFIINIDHAKADDIERLVELAKETVKEKFGFALENEIIFLKN